MLDRVAPLRHEHAAAARGDDLVPVEGEGRERSLAAGRSPAVGRTERLRGILDERDVVPGADLGEGLVVAALTVQIDCDDRADPGAGLPA